MSEQQLFDKKKKKKKTVSVDSDELKKIYAEALQHFKGREKKKKKPLGRKIKGKKIALKADPDDDTEQLLDELKEKLLKQEKQIKTKPTPSAPVSYWSKPEEQKSTEEVSSTQDEEKIDRSNLGPENWIKSERDYEYIELMERIFDMLQKKNPQLTSAGRTKRIIMKPPQVMKDGTKKTNFANFQEICQNMNRSQDHVSQFLFSELGTTGSIDSNGCLIIKGRFLGKSIENLLRRYMSEYVLCHMCNSLDTTLTRNPNTRLHSLHCSSCGATRTVAPVTKGFQAVTIPRKRRTEEQKKK